MTLTLSPQMEARVRKVAQMMGRDTDAAMVEMLNQALSQYEYARHELGEEEAKEVLAALQESAADFAAGRSILLEDFEEQIQERRRVRDGAKDTP
jgi:predicted transcriptional regulator